MKKLSTLLIISLILLIIQTNFALAAGLVPCGGSTERACTLCDFLKLINNITNWLIGAASALGVVFIVWGGFVIMMAGGSPEKATQGRQSITIAVVGIAIVLGAWLIVGTVIHIVTGSSSVLPWTEIRCT